MTILVNGFSEERLSLLQTNVRFFSSFTFVHSIYILWGNASTPDTVLDQVDFFSLGAPIYVVRQQSQSLNDRFLPRSYISTRAVMICDDDITVDGEGLELAFRTWVSNEQQLVGFFPRAHSYQLDSKSWIYSKLPDQYSILLTKLMILATEYLFLYTCRMPQGVKEYVDKGMNCEDLAMNFVVSNHSGLAPLLVEGKPRDWGDTRNSAEELSTVGLSARAGHRKDRGECIAVFHRLWGGLKLRFSYGKVSPYKEELSLCDKYGYLINCDEPVASKRHAQRLAGQNVVTTTGKYAYVTVLSSKKEFNSSLVLAQSLVSSGTVHDLVLLLHPSCGIRANNTIFQQHYDVVKKIKKTGTVNGVEAINAWLLTDYTKVVFIDVHTLVLRNLDHLFGLPEPTAAPHLSIDGHFDTSLLVLKPSRSTFTGLLTLFHRLPESSRTAHHLFNSFFRAWYQMGPEHRLPVRFSPPSLFSSHLVALSKLFGGANATYQILGPVAVVRTSRTSLPSELEVRHYGEVCAQVDYCQAWLHLFGALRGNGFKPLNNHSLLSRDSNATERWPVQSESETSRWLSASFLEMHSENSVMAFATAMWDSKQGVLVESWVATFARHHSDRLRCKTLLLVLSTMDSSAWWPYRAAFDTIVVVEPVEGDEVVQQSPSLMLLHLWNQTSYTKVVYTDAGSIFMDNCFSLFEYSSPFSAVPRCFPVDKFSTRLMVIEPNEQTFLSLVNELQSYHRTGGEGLVVDHLLNRFYFDWYQQPERHRIASLFSKDMQATISGLVPNDTAGPWKIWSFTGSKYESRWQSTATNQAIMRKLWGEALCSPESSLLNISLCKVVANEGDIQMSALLQI